MERRSITEPALPTPTSNSGNLNDEMRQYLQLSQLTQNELSAGDSDSTESRFGGTNTASETAQDVIDDFVQALGELRIIPGGNNAPNRTASAVFSLAELTVASTKSRKQTIGEL